MAFLGPAVRWPDSLVDAEVSANKLVEAYRPHLPAQLQSLPAPFLLAGPAVLAILLLALLTAVLRPTPKGQIAVPAHSRRRARKTGARTVLLIGPSESGKTSIFSALVYGSVPKTHTSQHESEGHTILGPSTSVTGETEERPAGKQSVPVHLIDLPGHPRLRTRANEFLPAADAVVFCVDATLAARAATASTAASAALSDAIDLFHSTLTDIATVRLKGNSPATTGPPSLQVLFTRSDLSPLLAASNSSTDDAQVTKRKAQLLQRARAGFEAELAKRRTALRIGRRGGATQIGGIGRVEGGSGSGAGSGGLLGRLRSLLGLSVAGGKSGDEDKSGGFEEDEEEDFDYMDWQTIQRQQASAAGARTALSLDNLDEEVVEGGKARWGVISLGRERDWLGGSGSAREGRDDRDLRAFLTTL